MNHVQIIIQARMTSSRLPGKVMLPLCDSTVLQVMIERLGELRDNVIIATTNNGSEAPIVALCKSLNIPCYRGDEDDVLERYYLAAKSAGALSDSTVVRLTSDCPVIDKTLCKKVITAHQSGQYDIVNLGPHSGFPRGLDACAFSFSLLERTHQRATAQADREHVTLGMAKFTPLVTYSLSAEEDLSDIRLTLDEDDDYAAIKALYEQFEGDKTFTYSELKAVLKSTPSIAEINRHVQQKTV